MKSLPTAPAPGTPVSSSLIRELIDAIRARTIMRGPGYRTRETPNGTALEIDYSSKHPKPERLPWTFSCTEDEDSGERTGGWKNCRLQIGYNYYLHSPDVGDKEGDDIFVKTIEDCDQTDDGEYWVEIDVLANEAKIIIRDDNADWSVDNPHDPSRNIVRIRIGEVEDGKQKYGFHRNPIVYKYV